MFDMFTYIESEDVGLSHSELSEVLNVKTVNIWQCEFSLTCILIS